MSPTTRSVAPKKGGVKKAQPTQSKTASVKKAAVKKAAVKKAAKLSIPKRKDPVEDTLPTVEEIRAAIRPEGTTVGDLMDHFKIRLQDRDDMSRLLASFDSIASDVSITSEQPASKSPFSPGDFASRATLGFRPIFDRQPEPSVAELAFGRSTVPKESPISPGRPSSAGGLFASTPRRSDFGRMASVSGGVPPGRALSAAAGAYNASSPRRSNLRRVASLNSAFPRRASLAAGVAGSSPRRSDFGRMASVSGSPQTVKTPPAPFAPQSPLASESNHPAKITVWASTKQEADAVLARQQLVRESLFELRGILTNLSWKVQQFEALVDKAEKDVVWDTVAAESTFDGQNQDQGGPKSGKRLRFLFDDTE